MEKLTQTMLRQVLRRFARVLPGLEEITPFEIEQLVRNSERHFQLDVESLARSVRRLRTDTLATDLIRAGASNRILRELFGLSSRQLSALRRKTGIHTYGTRRLTLAEERAVRTAWQASGRTRLDRRSSTIWCLQATRELDLPFMAIFHYTNHLTEEEPHVSQPF